MLWLVMTALLVAVPSGARVIEFDRGGSEVGFHVLQATDSFIEIRYCPELVRLDDIEVNGRIMEQVTIPGVYLPNEEGAPNLPSFARYVAIPNGATAELELLSSTTKVLSGIDVVPAPEPVPAGESGVPSLRADPTIYSRDAYYPEAPVRLSTSGRMRGVEVVKLGIMPFQYNPVTRDLVIYTSLTVRISFSGGTAHFGEDRLRNRYWEPILRGHLLNYSSLPKVDFSVRSERDFEYEFVIIVPNEHTETAELLWKWRTLQGIDTGIVWLMETGTTSSDIEQWITNAYYNWETPPVAVLLIGDYGPEGSEDSITAPLYHDEYCDDCDAYYVSDNYYADVEGDGDALPDVAIARMTTDGSFEQTWQVVTKSIDYERYPVMDPGFYDHPLVAGEWDWTHWSILCDEIFYGFWKNGQGKDPVREYCYYDGWPPWVWGPGTPFLHPRYSFGGGASTVVNYFDEGVLGYIPHFPTHFTEDLFNPCAEYTEINDYINDGAFMVMHQGHGNEYGWHLPEYDKFNLNGLHNEYLTFVLSINCLTGRFDWDHWCFAEKFHRMDNGAVGVIASSGISWSPFCEVFTLGFADGLWPGFDPTYSAPGYDNRDPALLPGFAQAYAKYYLGASSWTDDYQSPSEYKRLTYLAFHMHGDPFQSLYSEVPQELAVEHDGWMYPTAEEFVVSAEEGSIIALTQNYRILGVADGTGSPVAIPIAGSVTSARMRVTVTKPNHIRYSEDVVIRTYDVSDYYSSIEVSAADGLVFCPSGCTTADSILITVTVKDHSNDPVEGVPPGDIEVSAYNMLDGSNFGFTCISSSVLVSTEPTDANGQAFIPLTQAGGATQIAWLETRAGGTDFRNVPAIRAKSPDLDVDGSVGGIDFARFASYYGWVAEPGDEWCPADLNCDDAVNAIDFAMFVAHYGHSCESRETRSIPPDLAAEIESKAVKSSADQPPSEFALAGTTPNPSSGLVTVRYEVPAQGGHVKINIYDVTGRHVREIVDGHVREGRHAALWDGSDASGRSVSSGVYYCRMDAPGLAARAKVILLK